jgi:DNA repair photolyase
VWSITTCDEAKRRIIEPGTPPAAKLFDTIEAFCRAGISCGVNIDPIIPLVTDSDNDLDAIIENCRVAGVKHAFGMIMRLRTDIWDRMKMLFRLLELPDAPSKYREIYGFEEPIGPAYISAKRHYSEKVSTRLRRRIIDSGIHCGFPDSMNESQLNKSASGQMSMTEYMR